MDRSNFKDKIVIVTGGSRGIGKSIALAFGEAGASVVVTARKAHLLREVVEEIQGRGGDGFYVECDLTRDETIYNLIEKTSERYGRIDVLVNNAGIGPWVKKSEEVTKEMWEEVLQVNLMAPFLLMPTCAMQYNTQYSTSQKKERNGECHPQLTYNILYFMQK